MWGVERGGPDAYGSGSPRDAGEYLFLFHNMKNPTEFCLNLKSFIVKTGDSSFNL